MMPRWPTPSLSILVYHRVLARADPLFPEQPDHLLFERQLGLLKRFFTVMPLGAAVHCLHKRDLPPRAACITFDDGYADNAEVALPLLRRHGLSACFFIASAYMNGGQMWNDKVIEWVRHAPGSELDLSNYGLGRFPIGSLEGRRRAIAAILASLKYLPFDERQALAERMHAKGIYPARADLMMNTEQLRELQRAGMEIGAHTARHPILACMPDTAARADISNGKQQLESLIQAPVTLFAYPNGKAGQDYGARDIEIVKALGFQAAVSTDWGVARHGSGLFQLPRFTPWDQGRLRFLLRMGQNMLRTESSAQK